MRWALVLAMLAGLAAGSASAQEDNLHIAERSPDSHGATTATGMTKGLDRTAAVLATQKATASRIAHFDVAWPIDGPEYKALGGWGIILVTAVVADPAELPLKRTYIHRDQSDFDLIPIASRQTSVDPRSQLAGQVGAYRQDIFYLAPAALLLKDGALWADFAVNRQRFVIALLPLNQPEALRGASGVGMPEVAAVKRLFEREFRGFDGIEIFAFAP